MLFRSQKTSNSIKKIWLKLYFLVRFLYIFCKFYKKNERFAQSLFFKERCEWIAQVAHQKWAMGANRSGLSPKMSEWANYSFFEQITHLPIFVHFLAKNKQFTQKTDERIPNPADMFVIYDKRLC